MKIVLSPVGAPTQKLNFFLPHKNIERLCFVVYLNFNYERNFEMTEKLKVSREVANGLEVIKTLNSIEDILANHSIDDNAWVREAKVVNDLSLTELATALIVGYEVEMTPHEVIATEYITSQQEWFYNMHFHSKGFAEGIEFTLNTLGITVKGVNDNETI